MKSKIQVFKKEIVVSLLLAMILPMIVVTILQLDFNNVVPMHDASYAVTSIIDEDIVYGNWNSSATLSSYITTNNPKKLYIKNEAQLVALSEYVNYGGKTLEGIEIILLDNITCPQIFEPIGNSTNPFQGTFNGNGYEIYITTYNLVQEGDSRGYAGLFGQVGNNGIIKNLYVHHEDNGDNNFKIQMDTTDKTIFIGGIVASNYGCIQNCYYNGSIPYKNPGVTEDRVFLGGIAGWNRGIIKSCDSTGRLGSQAEGWVGGIAATVIEGGVIEQCYSNIFITSTEEYVNVNANNYAVGGIAGNINKGRIFKCVYKGEIFAPAAMAIGGIVGQAESCYSVDANSFDAGGNGIKDVINYGKIIGANYIGGIVGYMNNVSIYYSTNIGSVESDFTCVQDVNQFYVGGLVGKWDYENCIIKYCYVSHVPGVNAASISSPKLDFNTDVVTTNDSVVLRQFVLNSGKNGTYTTTLRPYFEFDKLSIIWDDVGFSDTKVAETHWFTYNFVPDIDGDIIDSSEYPNGVKPGNEFVMTESGQVYGSYMIQEENWNVTRPTITISANKINAETVKFDITGCENLNIDDIFVKNGSKKKLEKSGNKFVLEVETKDNGELIIEIPKGVASNSKGIYNLDAKQAKVTLDKTAPTLTITASEPDITNVTRITYTFTFSESVTGFTKDDIVVTNGTAGEFSGSGTTYTLLVTNKGSYTQKVSVAAGVCQDAAGNGNTAASKSIKIEKEAPEITLEMPTEVLVGEEFDIKISSTEDVQILYYWNDYGNESYSDYAKNFTISNRFLYNGTQIFYVDVKDKIGNTSTYSREVIVKEDLISLEIMADKTSPTNADSIMYTFVFSKAVTGFTKDDIVVTNGTKKTFSGSGSIYTLAVTNDGSCTQTVSVDEGVCSDSLGNKNTAASKSIIIEKSAPTLTITADNGSPTNADSITYTFTFSESVTGFTIEDIEVTNGEKETFTPISGTQYELVVKSTVNGTQTVSVDEGVCSDLLGNKNTAASKSIIIEKSAPTLTITADNGSPTNADSITYTFEFSKQVIGFTKEDIEVINGTKGEFTKISDTTYTLVVTNDGSCTQEVSVAEGKCYDTAENGNTAASMSIEIEKEKSELTIKADQPNPTNASRIIYTFTFSKPVTGFTKEDIIVENGIIGEFTVISDTTYTLVVDNTRSCIQTVKVAEGVCQDAIGNTNTGAEKTITIDKYMEINITGNPSTWTKNDVVLSVESREEIASVEVNGNVIEGTIFTVTENGTYTFIVKDLIGNERSQVIEVSKIDKDGSSITGATVEDKKITITANDTLSGVKEYAATTTTAEPTNWSTSNEITVGEDGEYYIWVRDNAGNVTMKEEKVSVNTVTIYIYKDTEFKGTIKFYHKVAGSDEYVWLKNLTDIYLKHGDKLKAEVEINDYLFAGLKDGEEIKLSDLLDENGEVIEPLAKEIYPALTIGEYYFEPVSATQTEEEKLTKVVYEFTNSDEEQEEVVNPEVKLDLTKNINKENMYMYYSDDFETFDTGDRINSISSKNIKVHIDGIPYLKTEIYAQEETASGRYGIGTPILIKVTSSEILKTYVNPEIKISFSQSGLGKYNYQEDSTKGNARLYDTYVDENGCTIWIYKYFVEFGDEGTIILEYLSASITDNADNTENIALQKTLRKENVYTDTTAPTVKITAQKIDGQAITNNITNGDIIRYILTFSEKVREFTVEDIVVNGGTKGELSDVIENSNGTYSYTIDVVPKIDEGNYGKVKLIVEGGSCKDILGLDNVKNEITTMIDKNAPNLVNIEIDCVDKELYKSGDKLTIIAVFDENIENTEVIPELELTFADTGLAKGELSQGKKAGNTITWEYTIATEDLGKLIIKELRGTVEDFAGNETILNSRNIDNYGIIADNIAPKGTITFDKNEMCKEDVTATITFDEEVIILNNEGKNTYTFTENGEFTFEFEDLAGNVSTETAVVTIIDKQAPVANIGYIFNKNGTITATITFDEEVIITNNEGKNTYIFTKNGEFTFEFKDLVGNEGSKVVIVDNMSETDTPEVPDEPEIDTPKVEGKIEFKDLVTKEENGIKYVKVNAGMSVEEIIAKMDSTKLEGQKPTVTNLSKDGVLKTGSEIKLNGETKYTVVVKGDVNCDGEVEFMGDIVLANNYRLGIGNLSAIQKLAVDINNNGRIDFLADIIAMNNYRLGILKSL